MIRVICVVENEGAVELSKGKVTCRCDVGYLSDVVIIKPERVFMESKWLLDSIGWRET